MLVPSSSSGLRSPSPASGRLVGLGCSGVPATTAKVVGVNVSRVHFVFAGLVGGWAALDGMTHCID